MKKEEDPVTNETARWLSAAVLTLASSINKQRGDTTTDAKKECEAFYYKLFGNT